MCYFPPCVKPNQDQYASIRKILDRQNRSAKPLAPCSVTERRSSSRIGGRRTSPPEKRAKSTGLFFERLDALARRQVRALDERLEATMREMGVTFDIARERPWGRRPWFCDVLPQIFTPEEWEPLEKGISQRLRAFELFLTRHLWEEGNSQSQSSSRSSRCLAARRTSGRRRASPLREMPTCI